MQICIFSCLRVNVKVKQVYVEVTHNGDCSLTELLVTFNGLQDVCVNFCSSLQTGQTKKVNLFSKDLLIFPICENNSHWYLVTAVRPGKADGFIFVLDSLGGGRKKALDNVIGYFEAEWDAKV